MFLTPPLIGASQPALAHVYAFWGNIDYILSHAHLSETICWYHAWPGSWLLYSILVLATGITNANLIITITPFLWELLYVPVLYLLLAKMSKGSNAAYMWGGVWLFILGDWVGQAYISAQSLSFFTYLLLLAIFIVRIDDIKNDKKTSTILILLLASLAITHIITSLIFLAVLLVFSIKKEFVSKFFAVFVGLLIFWNVYCISTAIPRYAPQLISNALNLVALFQLSVLSRFGGSNSRIDVLSVRLYTIAIVVSLCIAGYLLSLIKDKRDQQRRVTLKIILGVTLLTLILGAGGGFEIPYRIFMFMLPIGVYFASKLLKYKFTAIFFVACLIILLPLGIISQYGNQLVDYQSNMDIAALEYFHNSVQNGVLVGVVPTMNLGSSSAIPFGMFRNVENYSVLPYENIVWQPNIAYNTSYPLPALSSGDTLYVPIGDRDLNTYNFMYNNTESYWHIVNILQNCKSMNLIYNNGNMSIYVWENFR